MSGAAEGGRRSRLPQDASAWASPEAGEGKAAGTPATLLLCDDEPVLRMLVRATLESDEYAIVEASDGAESLDLARKLRPDIVVLDMMMPGRSGIDVLRELRSDPELASVPVVMLTARARTADREAALDAGADRYLAKPFSPLELISVVEELLAAWR
jgi:CheY-like chemotaxis protein